MPIQEAVTSWMNCICVSKELKNIYIYAYMQHCEIYVRGLASDRRRLRVIERFWIPLGLGMSSPQLFLVQEDEKDNRFNTTSLIIEEAFPRSDGPDPEIAPAVEPLEFQFQEEEDENNIVCEKQDLEWCTAAEETPSVSSSTKSQNQSLGQYELADDEDDDGFATPISSHHKIPVMAQCPPAPKKIRTPHSSSTKRKSPPRTRRHLHLDLSREVELMFPPTVRDDLGRKIKKARIED